MAQGSYGINCIELICNEILVFYMGGATMQLDFNVICLKATCLHYLLK